jgi:alpha-N-arabinofuranosidase
MALVEIDPRPTFPLSPYLYMQFMEPLGATEGSVEAGWDFEQQCWQPGLIAAARELGPTLIRWPGGILSSYYRWREAVGPRDKRIPMSNILWGGMETNQVGTHEFIDFCRQVSADPLIAVNFESDGKPRWARAGRAAGPDEAAAWVDYCNNPDNAARIANGAPEPFNVRLWQIGNETSYGPDGFSAEATAARTLAFARQMHQADPAIQLIGWGDSGRAHCLLAEAGEELAFIAFHHHFDSGLKNSPLRWDDYRVDPGWTWQHLMNAYRSTEARLQQLREETAGYGVGLALTESHFGLPGRNRCDVLASWAAGVANARILNVHARHGDVLKIATLADFFGTRWMNNAILIPTPPGSAPAYLLPVALVMSLYRQHTGQEAVDVRGRLDDLDLTASRTGDRFYLHVVNTSAIQGVSANLEIRGRQIVAGTVYEIARDPQEEVSPLTASAFRPETYTLAPEPVEAQAQQWKWLFPPASVSAVELEVEPAAPGSEAGGRPSYQQNA